VEPKPQSRELGGHHRTKTDDAYKMPDIIETKVINDKTQETITCRIEIIKPI